MIIEIELAIIIFLGIIGIILKSLQLFCTEDK